MQHNPILDLPLTDVMRPEIALSLRHLLQVHTVGGLLIAWHNSHSKKQIERIFDSPEQARHAVAVCSAWLGVRIAPLDGTVPQWWRLDDDDAVFTV
jgi:hypothetical protein